TLSGKRSGDMDVFACSAAGSRGGPSAGAGAALLGLLLVASWRRTRRPCAALVLALLPAFGAARTAAAAEPPKQKVAVMTLRAGPGVDPKVVDTVTDALAAEIQARPRLSVISSKDLEASLGLERQKALMGCSNESCLAQIGGALGVDVLVYGSLGRVGDTLLFQVQRLATRSQQVEKRFSARLDAAREEQVLEAIDAAACELFGGQPGARPGISLRLNEPLPTWRVTAGFQLLPSDHLSGAWSVSVGAQLGDLLSVELGALLSGVVDRSASVGALARLNLVPFNQRGRVRPLLALELPLLATPDFSMGAGGAVGLEFLPMPWLALGLEVPVYYMFVAPQEARQLYWFIAPRVGVRF
ncbi:MAG: hypothetical protein HY901_15660, partial [Deltaproteobacteria bacterium]|nr:hypothetical protein [Deltaproteobacteria bacterium]